MPYLVGDSEPLMRRHPIVLDLRPHEDDLPRGSALHEGSPSSTVRLSNSKTKAETSTDFDQIDCSLSCPGNFERSFP